MDLNEAIKYFCEQGLLGKRFILAFLIVLAWLIAFLKGLTIPNDVTTIVGMVLAFYFGTHTGTNEVV